MPKINKLPKDLEASLPKIRDEWLKIGLCTDPADRAAAEKGADLAYETAGLEKPKIKIWLNSPDEGAIAATMLAGTKQAGDQVKDQVWAQVGYQVWAQVRAQVRDQAWAQVGDQVWAQVRDQVGDHVGDQVRDQVWAQVGDQVWDQVWAQAWDQVRAQVGDQVWDQVWAQVRAQVWAQVRDQVRAQVRDQVWDQVWAQVWAQVRDQVRAQVGAQVRAQVRDQVRDQVWDQVRDQVRAQVRDQVWAQVWAQVRDQVWDQVWAQVWAQVRDQVRAQVGRAAYGQHDASWLAFYKVFENLVPETKKLKGLWQVSQSCGWWWPFESAVIFTDRPKTVLFDQNSNLHCEDGPAIEYRDGFKVHSWHGNRVPAHWIKDKDDLDPNEVLRIANVEQRAAGCQIIGWNKMLDHLPHKIIDSDPNPQHGDLIEVTLEGLPEPEWYLRFECPRNGTMMEGVNKRELSEPTVFAAQAWKSPLPDHLFNYPKTRS